MPSNETPIPLNGKEDGTAFLEDQTLFTLRHSSDTEPFSYELVQYELPQIIQALNDLGCKPPNNDYMFVKLVNEIPNWEVPQNVNKTQCMEPYWITSTTMIRTTTISKKLPILNLILSNRR